MQDLRASRERPDTPSNRVIRRLRVTEAAARRFVRRNNTYRRQGLYQNMRLLIQAERLYRTLVNG